MNRSSKKRFCVSSNRQECSSDTKLKTTEVEATKVLRAKEERSIHFPTEREEMQQNDVHGKRLKENPLAPEWSVKFLARSICCTSDVHCVIISEVDMIPCLRQVLVKAPS